MVPAVRGPRFFVQSPQCHAPLAHTEAAREPTNTSDRGGGGVACRNPAAPPTPLPMGLEQPVCKPPWRHSMRGRPVQPITGEMPKVSESVSLLTSPSNQNLEVITPANAKQRPASPKNRGVNSFFLSLFFFKFSPNCKHGASELSHRCRKDCNCYNSFVLKTTMRRP